jgi:hypothetical protein
MKRAPNSKLLRAALAACALAACAAAQAAMSAEELAKLAQNPVGNLISLPFQKGPVVQVPTNTSGELGNKNWGLGPSFVVLHLDHGSPWVYGVLVNNIWSLTSNRTGGAYNNGLVQPFVNYNFKDGLYLTSAPIVTVDWKAEGSQQWTVPVGGGVGKIFHLGKLPVNTQLSAYYNVVRPDFQANWQIRAQAQLMFPK